MACFGVGMLLLIPLWAVLPAVLGHVAATNSFRAAFHFHEWWRILRANIGGFLVAMILIAGVYAALLLVIEVLYFTIILCIAVPFLMAFISAYLLVIANVLFAQAYREGLQRLETEAS
jgi:uncharacterized protein DUF4013